MSGIQRTNLVTIIGNDLLMYFKLPIFLLFINIVSALSVVYVTYETRLLTEQREQLILEYNKLNVEWRNLILEEYVFGDHNRIRDIATRQLNMRNVTLAEEQIVIKNE